MLFCTFDYPSEVCRPYGHVPCFCSDISPLNRVADMGKFNQFILHIDIDFLRDLCLQQEHPVSIAKNVYFLRAGEVSDCVGYVESGIFRYTTLNHTEQREYNVGLVFPGEFIADYPSSRYLDMFRLTPEERYQKLLERCPDLLQQVSLREIASYLGITPTHMSRIRRRLTFCPSCPPDKVRTDAE